MLFLKHSPHIQRTPETFHQVLVDGHVLPEKVTLGVNAEMTVNDSGPLREWGPRRMCLSAKPGCTL